jgi:hypothetical protein
MYVGKTLKDFVSIFHIVHDNDNNYLVWKNGGLDVFASMAR